MLNLKFALSALALEVGAWTGPLLMHGRSDVALASYLLMHALACLMLSAQVQGSEVTTIEGLAQGDTLHPVQEAFIEHDGYQCGYCTPGQIMSAVALLKEGKTATEAEIREGMSGNLCRCAAYPHIIASVQAARDRSRV